MDKEISKLLEDNEDNEMDFDNNCNENFIETFSILELKTDDSSQFNQKFAKLVKNESEKLKSMKTLRPTIITDFHDTSTTSTQADFLSRSKNITPNS